MNPFKKLRRSTTEDNSESGAALVLVAFSMTMLIAFAAFSVDFGWLFWNAIRIQHGADAAALAGVIYEPGDQTAAYAAARSTATVNGYNGASAGTSVLPEDYTDNPGAVDNQFQLAVTIDHAVPTFFMQIFGVDSISISKKAVAEYVLPLPMGSDLPYFGTDPSDASRQPNFWGNIHGYYTGRKMGDRFASQCHHGGSTSDCTPNDERRETSVGSATDGDGFPIPVSGGYLYGVEVPPGGNNLTVEIFDGPFYDGGDDFFLVGDQPQGGPDGDPGPVTWFILYEPDPTPLNTTDNNILCTVRYEPEFTFADFDDDGTVDASTWPEIEAGLPGGIASLWDTLCTTSAGSGVYPLRVVIENPGPDPAGEARGLNRYSMRASTATGSQPRFYGLGDMAIYANFSGNQATFNLAEVYPVHAGKQLVIELWDPDSGNNNVEIRLPDNSLPNCTWTSTDPARPGGGPAAPCSIAHTGFDGFHMQIRIDVDGGYTCDTSPSGNCWWTIEVTYPGGANDTTTWSSRIEGNPVKLVE